MGNSKSGINGSCEVQSSGMFIILRISSDNRSFYFVNATLSFTGGSAICGQAYGKLPETDTGWVNSAGRYEAHFNYLNATRELLISKKNLEVFDRSGNRYGEWPFWLQGNDLKQRYTVVLYSLESGFNEQNFSGIATVIPLDLLQRSAFPYYVNGATINPDQQIYANKSVLPNQLVLEGVNSTFGQEIIASLKKSYTSCMKEASCKFRQGAFLDGGTPEFFYSNGSVISNYSPAFNSLNLSYKAYKFYPEVFLASGHVMINSTPVLEKEYTSEVNYAGNRYIATGFPSQLGGFSASYTINGVLLYVSAIQDTPDLMLIIPYAILEPFGIYTAYQTSLVISLQLISVK